jgi:hypothetical protein
MTDEFILDKQRQATMNDPKFIKWCAKFKVSRSVYSNESKFKASEMMKQYESQDNYYIKISKVFEKWMN